MSSSSPSFVDKLREILSKLFKSKKNKSSSFKTPQELQKSKNEPSTSPPAAGLSAATTTSPPPAPVAAQKLPQQPVSRESAPTPLKQPPQHPAHRSIPRIQESERSADVSPTDPQGSKSDRPHSEAVSALEQEEVAERLNKNSGTESAQTTERPISDLATDSVHTVQSPTIAEATETESPIPAEQTKTDSSLRTAEVQEEPATVEEKATAEQKPMLEAQKESPDRVDPLTAPEVVNEFDDEKVPVIAEPQINIPTETKFRMSATSGPLEDFPVGGEY